MTWLFMQKTPEESPDMQVLRVMMSMIQLQSAKMEGYVAHTFEHMYANVLLISWDVIVKKVIEFYVQYIPTIRPAALRQNE